MPSGDLFQSVVSLDDPLGVLSIYVGLAPEEESHPRPAWELELRHGLDGALGQLEAEGDEARAVLTHRLQALREQLDLLVSPSESGLGRALFARLSGGEPIQVSFQQPFRTRVKVAGCALVRPLAAALEAGRPAGLVLVSEEGLRVCEWRLGEVEELEAIPLIEPGDQRELLGPSAAHPRGMQQAGAGFLVGQQRDLYERRAEEGRVRALAHVSAVGDSAAERGWEEVVLAGSETLSSRLADGLRDRGELVVLEPRVLGWESPAQLAREITPVLAEERSRAQLALLERVRGSALAGGRAAIGLADTLTALSEGRVELLLLPAERELQGSRSRDGGLYPPDVLPPGISAFELVPEGLLAERMVQRARATDARICMLQGDAEAALGVDEAAALLRW
jgi:hypothetical protein